MTSAKGHRDRRRRGLPARHSCFLRLRTEPKPCAGLTGTAPSASWREPPGPARQVWGRRAEPEDRGRPPCGCLPVVQALGSSMDGPLQRHLVLEQMPPPRDRRQCFTRRRELEGEDLARFRICTVDAGRPRSHLLLFYVRKRAPSHLTLRAWVQLAGRPAEQRQGCAGREAGAKPQTELPLRFHR